MFLFLIKLIYKFNYSDYCLLFIHSIPIQRIYKGGFRSLKLLPQKRLKIINKNNWVTEIMLICVYLSTILPLPQKIFFVYTPGTCGHMKYVSRVNLHC